jgi:quinoprotein glucose dehydrogenase
MLSSPLGFGPKKPPCNPPPWGLLTAVDLNTGETRWKIPFGKINVLGPFESREAWGSPNQGGPIITRGGLVFIGASPDNRLRAYDLQTGDQVWAGEIPAPAIATPMTYEYEGRQFVVVAAGGRQDFQTDISDAIVAFALPETD